MSSLAAHINVLKNKKDWHDLLENVGYYDFYHTYDYHHLSKSADETPILIKYEKEDKIIGLPLLLRKIFDTDYYDITSVYGYAGPIQKNIDNAFDNLDFRNQLQLFFKEQKVVSVFSRLNPLIQNQQEILDGLGEIKKLSQVVNIDLTLDPQIQRSLFSKTTKRYINKARKLCSIKSITSKEDISIFMKLYYENMDRVQARKSYYFDKDYFYSFINSTDFDTEILCAVHNETEEVISAAMMVKTNDIIQYHISGTLNDYLHLTPIRLLIDEMRIKGTDKKYRYFNLGGGLGSSEDSLFRFKSSFSKDYKDFKIWRYIVNKEVYKELSATYSNIEEDSDFFPRYRKE
ncbi:GNAT family N-acetyltransferase [Aquimarina sp. 2201CG5-10]|uniref:GNAT family N-acetyltransferase n=1 Tax=Aquimarina callyspongiae TaxID=3098150 RepID=UPI002AB40CF3|nr:GNAT family N-acetyltransferase [Aquimarina sp. 2201CG5-10]MDY8136277.1 GNAT family N-acetyltransferase [Aquimarina sp. 2201CG5-10]